MRIWAGTNTDGMMRGVGDDGRNDGAVKHMPPLVAVVEKQWETTAAEADACVCALRMAVAVAGARIAPCWAQSWSAREWMRGWHGLTR